MEKNEDDSIESRKSRIAPKKSDILDRIPEEHREEVLELISYQRTHIGPLPPPEILEQYNNVVPDGAERIIRMAEKQQNHRMELEKRFLISQSAQSKLGQWFGLIIGVFGLSTAAFLGYFGAEIAAAGIGGGTLVGLVSAFLAGKKSQKKEDRPEE